MLLHERPARRIRRRRHSKGPFVCSDSHRCVWQQRPLHAAQSDALALHGSAVSMRCNFSPSLRLSSSSLCCFNSPPLSLPRCFLTRSSFRLPFRRGGFATPMHILCPSAIIHNFQHSRRGTHRLRSAAGATPTREFEFQACGMASCARGKESIADAGLRTLDHRSCVCLHVRKKASYDSLRMQSATDDVTMHFATNTRYGGEKERESEKQYEKNGRQLSGSESWQPSLSYS